MLLMPAVPKAFHACTASESSILCSRKPVTRPYSEPHKSGRHEHILHVQEQFSYCAVITARIGKRYFFSIYSYYGYNVMYTSLGSIPSTYCNTSDFPWIFFYRLTARVDLDFLMIEVLWLHSDTPHSVRLVWMNDRPVAEICTWQHTTLTTDRQTCPRWDSNP
jgi:hypothetical protein